MKLCRSSSHKRWDDAWAVAASVVNYVCNSSALEGGECRRSVFLVTDRSESRVPAEEPPVSDELPSLVINRTFVLLHRGSLSLL